MFALGLFFASELFACLTGIGQPKVKDLKKSIGKSKTALESRIQHVRSQLILKSNNLRWQPVTRAGSRTGHSWRANGGVPGYVSTCLATCFYVWDISVGF